MTLLSPHLSEEEIACHDGTPYPFDQVDSEDLNGRTWRITRATPLAALFEAIRQVCGGEPITVDSGYRTLAYDTKLYEADQGAGNVAMPQESQHPKGRALDLVHASLLPTRFFNTILECFAAGKNAADGPEKTVYRLLGGLGLYPSFVHIDIRLRPTSDHLAIWGGTRPSNIV